MKCCEAPRRGAKPRVVGRRWWRRRPARRFSRFSFAKSWRRAFLQTPSRHTYPASPSASPGGAACPARHPPPASRRSFARSKRPATRRSPPNARGCRASWVRWRRRTDPEFAARMAVTLAAARERLRAAASVEPRGCQVADAGGRGAGRARHARAADADRSGRGCSNGRRAPRRASSRRSRRAATSARRAARSG